MGVQTALTCAILELELLQCVDVCVRRGSGEVSTKDTAQAWWSLTDPLRVIFPI